MFDWKGNYRCHFWGDTEWDSILAILKTEKLPFGLTFSGYLMNFYPIPTYNHAAEIIGEIIAKKENYQMIFQSPGLDQNIYLHEAALLMRTRFAKGRWSDMDDANQNFFHIDFSRQIHTEFSFEKVLPISPIEFDSRWKSVSCEELESYYDELFEARIKNKI